MLVEANPGGVQPECASDYLAVTSRPHTLTEKWAIEPPYGLEEVVTRVLDQAGGASEGYRCCAARLLATGPAWLRNHPLAAPACRALELDVSRTVRVAFSARRSPSEPAEHADAPEPSPTGRPADVLVLAERVGLRALSAGPERLPGDVRPGELAVRDASFHVRAGQLLGVLADDPFASSELLRAIAGFVRPAAGRIAVEGRPVLLPLIGEVLEERLSIRDNIVVLAAFLGAHVPEVTRRIADVAQAAGLEDGLDTTLREAGPVTAVRLALAVALELASPRVLLLGELPAVDDSSFRSWARSRADSLCGSGAAIVQAVADPSDLVAPARSHPLARARRDRRLRSPRVGRRRVSARHGSGSRTARERVRGRAMSGSRR